jgi:2-methylcitrate dehydratase PrpD
MKISTKNNYLYRITDNGMEITRKIAQLTKDSNYEAMNPLVQERAKYLLLDYLGVAIRGS